MHLWNAFLLQGKLTHDNETAKTGAIFKKLYFNITINAVVGQFSVSKINKFKVTKINAVPIKG